MPHFLNLACFIFLFLVTPIQSCLDPKEQPNKCTSCISSHFLKSGKCYEKQKGCLEHEVKGEDIIEIICIICQNGYLPFEKKCQRKALVELRLGESASKLNQPAPVIIDKLSKLSQLNITGTGKLLPESAIQNLSKKEKKIQKYFPQIVTEDNQHKSKKKFRQKQEAIDSIIVAQYPFLENLQSIKLLSPRAVDDAEKYFLFYPEGTILLVQKTPKQLGNIRNAAQIAKDNYDTKIVFAGRQVSIFNQISTLLEFTDLQTVSLSLNIGGRDPDGKSIDLNVGFGSDLRSFKGAGNEKQQQAVLKKARNEMQKRKQHEKYFKLAYAQFLSSMPILNIPDIVDRIKIQKQSGKSGQKTITFNVSFLVEKDSEKQEAIIRYDIQKNVTQILGYYVEGTNILSFFKNITQLTDTSQNNTNDIIMQSEKTEEGSKKRNFDSPVDSNQESTSKDSNGGQIKGEDRNIRDRTAEAPVANKSQPLSQQKQVQAGSNNSARDQKDDRFLNSTNQETRGNATLNNNKIGINTNTVSGSVNENQAKNESEKGDNKNGETKIEPLKTSNLRKDQQDFGIRKEPDVVNKNASSTTSQVQVKQTKNESFSKNVPLSVKTWSQLLPILRLKESEIAKATNNYKLISFSNETNKDKSEVTYLITIFTERGIIFIRVLEDQISKQIQVNYTANNSEKCIDLANETIIPKLDSVLKKSYPFLASYNKNGSQYMLDSSGQKYILIYSNDQLKKLFYEVSKTKDSTKYLISKSGVFDSGYCFEKKDMETINLKITDFEQDLSNLKSVRSTISQLLLRFKPFISTSIVISALSNTTHIKVYLSNRFVTFEYTKKLDDAEGVQSKGNLVIVQQKYGYDYWPVGAKKEYIPKQPSELYQKIEEAVLKKYKFYFSNGTNQIYIKQSQNRSYEVAFKNLFGYFILSVEVTDEGCKLGSLKKTGDFDDLKFMFCKPTEHWQIQDKRCFRKVSGCFKQIGGICIACQLGLNLSADMKKCSKMCF